MLELNRRETMTSEKSAVTTSTTLATPPATPTPPPQEKQTHYASIIPFANGSLMEKDIECSIGIGSGGGNSANSKRRLKQKHKDTSPWQKRNSWLFMLHETSDATTMVSTQLVSRTNSIASDPAPGATPCGRVFTISGDKNNSNAFTSDYEQSHGQTTTVGSNNVFHYNSTTVPPMKNLSNDGSYNLASGSTIKLLAADERTKQTKCSIFRLVLLCLCLNISYSNIVRFPRELDRYGTAYLIPYVSLLCLVGFPLILLEVSVGQFLGQGSAHTWRASPIFKGASIVGRFASWLSSLWISLQAVFALAYIGMFALTSFPFRDCSGNIKLAYENGYSVIGNSGQECLHRTFLLPFWNNPFYFGMLAVGLLCIWIVVMLCTHNGTTVRRSLLLFGLLGFVLLVSLAGWEVRNALQRGCFPQLWPFDVDLLLDSNLWFSALLQMLYGTSCGYGVLPVLTGKFLYKGDAVRTSVVYLCFGLLINAVAVTLFMVQFDLSANGNFMIDELKPLTAIYDRMVYDKPSNELLVTLTPCLIYALVILSAVVSIIVAIYSSTRLVPRHPTYVSNLLALVLTVAALTAPQFIVGRVLDSRIVGTLVITALVFELIALTWIYGTTNLYTDLEFSIGRPIFKGWMALWLVSPAILTGILVWWCSDDDRYDLLAVYLPRWAPILFVLAVILISAAVQIFRQFEYNFFGMICEASKSAKEWGPADPLARHAWKQWRTVCQHTEHRDYTLRRRGTRDYTHSVKRANKLTNGHTSQPANWKCSTPGNSSPNYSGSVFGDSAIEEDMSVDKYPVVPSFPTYGSAQRTRVHCAGRAKPNATNGAAVATVVSEQHREIVYIGSYGDPVAAEQHAARIEITPSNESITYGATRNPLSRPATAAEYHGNSNANGSTTTFIKRSDSHRQPPTVAAKLPPAPPNGHRDDEHVCWRRFPYDGNNFATEL